MDLSIKTFLCLLLFATSAPAFEVVYGPALCAPEDLTLFASNPGSTPQRFWTQVRREGLVQEKHFDLEAREELKIEGSRFLASPSEAYSLKALERNKLRFFAQCRGEQKLLLTGVTSPQVDHYLQAGTQYVRLSILNLYLGSQEGSYQFYGKDGRRLSSQNFLLEKYYETQMTKLKVPPGAVRLRIQGKQRLHSQAELILDLNIRQSPGLVTSPATLSPPEGRAYFLVSTKDPRPEESFVIALDEMDKIEKAREQIRRPELEKIIIAGVTLGHGGFNRAFQAKDKAPYSWSVSRVDAFADFAHIDCDGSPDLTEERLEEKLSSGGRICFWRYRVVRELTWDEVALGRIQP